MIPKSIIFVCIVFVCGCSAVNNPFKPKPITQVCSSVKTHYDIGRFSFALKLNNSWRSSLKNYDQSVSFHFRYPEQKAFAATIGVNSYRSRITWLEDTWDDIDEIARRLQIDYDHQTFKKTRKNQYHDLKIVNKAGLNCIREEESWGAPQQQGEFVTPFSGSFENNLDYICLVPHQLDRRPINIGVAQSVGSRATPLDLEALLEPIFESLVLNPDPPPVPKRYEWVPVSKEEALKYWW